MSHFCCSKVFQDYEFSTCKTSQRYCSYYHEARVILVTIPTPPIRFLLLFLLLLGREHNCLSTLHGALALWFSPLPKHSQHLTACGELLAGCLFLTCTCWQIYKTSTCFQVPPDHICWSLVIQKPSHLQEIHNTENNPHFKTLNCGKIQITYHGLGRSLEKGTAVFPL